MSWLRASTRLHTWKRFTDAEHDAVSSVAGLFHEGCRQHSSDACDVEDVDLRCTLSRSPLLPDRSFHEARTKATIESRPDLPRRLPLPARSMDRDQRPNISVFGTGTDGSINPLCQYCCCKSSVPGHIQDAACILPGQRRSRRHSEDRRRSRSRNRRQPERRHASARGIPPALPAVVLTQPDTRGNHIAPASRFPADTQSPFRDGRKTCEMGY